jgi:hypothetical protein
MRWTKTATKVLVEIDSELDGHGGKIPNGDRTLNSPGYQAICTTGTPYKTKHERSSTIIIAYALIPLAFQPSSAP